MSQVYSEGSIPVIALIKRLPRNDTMPKSYTVTFKDYETQPELIDKAAALHGIPPEMLLKRFISKALDEYREPMKDISQFDSLEEFFKGNGLKK